MKRQLLDAEALAKASQLNLQARTIVEGLASGLHRSPLRGRDVEFAEHREYTQGDELRHIDWKVYGRSGRYFVKRFEQETEAKVQLIVDCSKSMLVDTHGESKLSYAQRMAACLAYVLLRQGDGVGLILFDEVVRTRIGAQGHLEHLSDLTEALVRAEPGPDTNIAGALAEIAGSLPRRQVMILLSDLIDEVPAVVEAVGHLHARRHDVIVLQILDPQELRFDLHGGVRIRDLESGQILEVDADRIRNLYRKEAERVLAEYELRFNQKAIDYVMLETTTPLADGLLRLLSHRGRVRARR